MFFKAKNPMEAENYGGLRKDIFWLCSLSIFSELQLSKFISTLEFQYVLFCHSLCIASRFCGGKVCERYLNSNDQISLCL